jgi:hypothetical protein
LAKSLKDSHRVELKQAFIAFHDGYRTELGISVGREYLITLGNADRSCAPQPGAALAHRSRKRSRSSLRCSTESRAQGAPAVSWRFDPQRIFIPSAASEPRLLAPQLSKINVQTIARQIDRSGIVAFVLPS